MAKAKQRKEVDKAEHHTAKEGLTAPNQIEQLNLPAPFLIALALALSVIFWLALPSEITFIIFAVFALSCTAFLFITAVTKFKDFQKNQRNIIPAVIGLMLLLALFSYRDPLLSLLFTGYLIVSVLFSSKKLSLQTAIIICLAITAILFRVYPALPGTGPSPGHLISMDDPYYHYKYTEDLYTTGDIPDVDYRLYPPNGKTSSQLFPYYYNTYLALLTGLPLHHVMILYSVLISAFGAVLVYLLLKELTNDWKSGWLGGLLFATLPVILTKSTAGATEEDSMGMVLGVLSIYLLIRAIKSDGSKSMKFAAMSGLSFFITFMTWNGVQFLYAVPFAALGVYALFSMLFKYDIWVSTRAALVAGVIPILGNSLLVHPGSISLQQIAPYGFFLFFGVWSEVIRVRFWHGEDKKSNFEKKYLLPFAALMVLLAVLFVIYFGPGQVLNLPSKFYDRFAGVSSRNFLVDKTISEQGALASGDLWNKLHRGLASYGIGEALTLLMAFVLPAFIIYNYLTKNKDRMFELLLAYLMGLVFFVVAMTFVWVEARLAFSQSLGFIMLGATAGLLLPKNLKELHGIKMLPFILILAFLLVFTFFSLPQFTSSGMGSAWEDSQRPASVDPAWFLGVKWLDAHITPGSFLGNDYVNGDYVFTWWDYGHFITALSRSTVITDPTQADEEYIMRTARFFYNTTSEADAIKWLMEQPWNAKDANGEYKTKYIILDYTLVGKASALTFLGTNYYQYPNGHNAVNGVCDVGELCQNVENGIYAKESDGDYTCGQGVVCPRDQLVHQITEKKCCEANPMQCCNMSFDNAVIDEKSGSAKILRPPGYPVYDQYALDVGTYACRPEYSTSLEPIVVIEDGVSKRVMRRYLYVMNSGGMPYADGTVYPAFIVFIYNDDTQKIKLISKNCETKDYESVRSLNKDVLANLGYGKRLSKDIVAPQIFVHASEKWLNSMFTQLYLLDARNLEYIDIILDSETKEFYPSVKIYEITYPADISELSEENETEQPIQNNSAESQTNQPKIYDYYDESLKAKYGLTLFPSLVWGCEFIKQGSYSNLSIESGALKKITCVVDKAKPTELCNQLGIRVDAATGLVTTSDSSLKTLLSTLKKAELGTPCESNGTTHIQAFYQQNCTTCDEQKHLLSQLKDDFGDYIDISYYCVGDEDYCKANSANIIG